MPRIGGVDIPEQKKVEFSLRYIYGIGPVNAIEVLRRAGIELGRRTHTLSPDEVSKLQKIVEEFQVEGELRKQIRQNIARLKDISAYRGIRHMRGLPVRGQRTKTNARTKRGKRVTIGALKKDVLAQKEQLAKEKEKKEAKK